MGLVESLIRRTTGAQGRRQAGQAAVRAGGGEPTERCTESSPWQGCCPSNAVALAIASREHLDVSDLPPLRDSIDTEGLDALLRSAPDANVTFSHHGYEVAILGEGEVSLTRLEDA